ncbi:MAG: bifunctional phosphopantothenoylcysteine decarboxylase/phosphopantothenate--cysteine ligase CoaBC [Chloroflexota bacterium]
MMLTDKTVVLGITGGIAVYKAADIASKLNQAGARVYVVMTEAATKFVTPLTLRTLTGQPVSTDVFESYSGLGIGHITLARMADVVAIVPATANTIAKLAAGIADNLLGCVVLATRAPVMVAPSMESNMFQNPVTQGNLAKLRERGFTIIEPASGRLASGKVGVGRLPETEVIIGAICQVLGRGGDLAGRRIVVTAGGTREPIDPVRHIGNRSSGKMGYAIASAARDRGALVSLITASASLAEPAGVKVVRVETAAQMEAAVTGKVARADVLIMAAAVADYQAKKIAGAKIKKAAPDLTLELVRTPDILAGVKGDFLRVGFAAESQDVVAGARRKLKRKRLDLIVANDITDAESGFDVDTNRVTIIGRDGNEESLPLLSKREVAERILDRVAGLLG